LVVVYVFLIGEEVEDDFFVVEYELYVVWYDGFDVFFVWCFWYVEFEG